MNRITLCLAGYVCGLVLAQYLTLPPPAALFSSSVLLLLLLLLNHKPRVMRYGLLFFCLLTGLLRYPAQLAPSDAGELDSLLNRGTVGIEGRVLSTHDRPAGSLIVDLMVLSVESRPVRRPAENRLRLYIDDMDRPPPVGSRLAFRSKVRRTRNFGIPGEFDTVRHLAYRRIWHTTYLQNPRGLAIFAGSPQGLRAYVDSLRQAGLSTLDRTLEPDDAILLKGLLLGEKGAMPGALRQQLAGGGIAHLFAISGLHLGLLALLIYILLKYIYSRSTRLLQWQPPVRVLWPLILPALFFYLLLTGDALATRRAFYALLVPVTLCLIRRRIAPLNLLCALAFLFLLVEPLALWQPSLLLSFSGVLGILLWQKPLARQLHACPRPLRYPLQLLGFSLAAFIATLPAVVFIFHLLAPAGLLCNLFAIPLVGFAALPLGLAGLMLSAVLPVPGGLLLQASAWVLQLVVDLAGFFSALPGLFARSLYLTLPESIALLMACLLLLVAWQRQRALLLLLPVGCLFAFGSSAQMAPELIVFSVGQGESMLLRVAGKNLLIDGGGLRSESFDVGERLLAPALGWLGVKTLDAIILTHDHPDHSGGLPYIIDNFDVREFWSTQAVNELRPGLGLGLLRNGVEIHQFDFADWRRCSPGGLSSAFLFKASLAAAGENDRSLCLYLTTPGGGVLLTGDLEARGVEALMKSPLPGNVSVLKAPHHGSRSSAPAKILAKFDPEIVLVSAGYENSYHLPARELLDQAKERRIRVWRTDLDGTVRLRLDGPIWQVDHWVEELFR